MNRKKNKENAKNFYRLAFEGFPEKSVRQYVGETYIQHNPVVADGPDGFIEYFTRMHEEFPGKRLTFLRAVGEENLVALHTHQVWPGEDEYITMDIFRFDEQGKIVEHWDAIQKIPEHSSNSNGMC